MFIKIQSSGRTVGILHELPDGRIARSYGFNGPKQTVSYYFDDGKGGHTVSYKEFAAWKDRRDLADFPNARDPRLPYVFDLIWDMQYESELRHALSHGHDDLDSIKETMASTNFVFKKG